MILQAAPQLRVAALRAEIDAAIASVLNGDSYILGTAVGTFERAFAAYSGVNHAIGVASGTDAIALALRGLGIGTADEVIVPALTFAGTAQAVLHIGAVPRFVDVDPITRCLDVAAAEAAINPRTKAILPVHLFGYPCDMPKLMTLAARHGLAVVEDCAQAHGASLNCQPLGSFGHAAAFSFYPTKNLGGIGDGGAVLTNDEALAARIRSLRNYGFDGGTRISQTIGFNSRLDEIQAAILAAMLPHLDEANAARRAIAARYRTCLEGAGLGLPPENAGCVFHQFAITCDRRDALQHHLAAAGIGTAVHYSPSLHQHPAFANGDTCAVPVSEKLSATLLSLPIQPEVAMGAVETVSRAILGFLRK